MARKQSQNKAAAAELVWDTASVEETHALAGQMGKRLKRGDVLALDGELGSGKTTFVQGLVKGLGIGQAAVKSPTFVLMREYPGAVPVVHIDAYRLDSAPAAAWLDVEQLIDPNKITIIEWAGRVAELLPESRIDVKFEHLSTNRRRIRLSGQAGRAKELHSALASTVTVHAATAVEEKDGTTGD